MANVTPQWVEQRLEELLLMDEKARERINDVEKIIEKHSNNVRAQELELHRISSRQVESMVDLSQMVKSLDRWITLVIKIGMAMTVVVAIVVFCFIWWDAHVNDLLDKVNSQRAYVMMMYRNIPTFLDPGNGNVYVRVVPGSAKAISPSDGGVNGAQYAVIYSQMNSNDSQDNTQ